jgi:hypothetical protein
MLEIENNILDAINETGQVATQAVLKRFDTDGSPWLHAACESCTNDGRCRTPISATLLS